ncbi:MAG: hypothetical protein KDD70_15845 [Bdellovibrionales bacterium]|nr:hypothetical protein [Bdellovibrionales bacterium]
MRLVVFREQFSFLFLTSCKELARELLEDFEEFCFRCKECYQEWLKGNFLIQWPSGAYQPPLPPTVNLVEFA